MEWIKCSDRLPKENETVLLATDLIIEKGQLIDGSVWVGKLKNYNLEGITQWNYLPKPPEVEGESK